MRNIPLPRRALACLATALLLITLLPARASAWGYDGHRIVAAIAEQNLSAAARKQVNQILASGSTCKGTTAQKMMCVANWPDSVRKTTHKFTYNWHFVDISLGKDNYDEDRDCEPKTAKEKAKGECGILGLEYARQLLRGEKKDKRISPARALMFVIHIVGDLHQPLHTVLEETGGNSYFVVYDGETVKLHEVWDSTLITDEMKDKSWGDERYASEMEKEINKKGLASFQQDGPIDWLVETHGVAINGAYAGLPKVFKKTVTLDPHYFDRNISVVNVQLERAGARLAKILNEDLH